MATGLALVRSMRRRRCAAGAEPPTPRTRCWPAPGITPAVRSLPARLIRPTGQVFCKGENTYGQLGVGVRGSPPACQDQDDCAEDSECLEDGYCHQACQNDDDCAEDSECLENGYCHFEPITGPVNGLPRIQQVAVAARHVCARSRGGAVYCWGSQVGLAQVRRIIIVIDGSIKVDAWARSATPPCRFRSSSTSGCRSQRC